MLVVARIVKRIVVKQLMHWPVMIETLWFVVDFLALQKRRMLNSDLRQPVVVRTVVVVRTNQ